MDFRLSRNVVWKELRQARMIVAMTGLLCAGIVLLSAFDLFDPFANLDSVWQDGTTWYFMVAISALTGLLLGASAFAQEKENGTDAFLSNLPIAGTTLVTSKILTGLTLTALFTSIAILALGLFCESTISSLTLNWGRDQKHWILLIPLLVSLEFYLWGLLFSLLVNRTLPAIFLGGIFCILLQYSVAYFAFPMNSTGKPFHLSLSFTLARVMISTAVLVTAGVLGSRWIKNLTGQRSKSQLPVAAMTVSRSPQIAKRLVWQTARDSFWPLSILVVTILMIGLLTLENPVFIAAAPLLTAIGFTVLGLLTFWKDQSRGAYLFFQQHAEYGRWVWLGRTSFWLAVASVLLATLVSIQPIYQILLPKSNNLFVIFVWFLGCFGIGQLFSMSFRSGLLSTFFAVIGSTLFTGLILSLSFNQIGSWWNALPIAVSCFVATFVYAPNWISGRRPILSHVTKFGLVLAATVAAGLGIAAYSYYEIPNVPMPAQTLLAEYSQTMQAHGNRSTQEVRAELDAIIEETRLRMLDPNTSAQVIQECKHNQPFYKQALVKSALDSETRQNFSLARIGSESSIDEQDQADADTVQPDHSNETLDQYLKQNRTQTDALLGINDTQNFLPYSKINSENHKAAATRLLIANAERHLRDGKLEKSLRSAVQLANLLSVIHFDTITADFSEVNRFLYRWVHHPDQTHELLQQYLEIPGHQPPHLRMMMLGLSLSTDQEIIGTQSKSQRNFPIQTRRLRNITEWGHLADRYDIKRLLPVIADNKKAIFIHQWLAEPVAADEHFNYVASPAYSMCKKFMPGAYTYEDPMVFKHHERNRFEAAVMSYRLKHGSYPAKQRDLKELCTGLKQAALYQPSGMDGDVFISNGSGPELFIEKDQPFVIYTHNAWPQKWSRPIDFDRQNWVVATTKTDEVILLQPEAANKLTNSFGSDGPQNITVWGENLETGLQQSMTSADVEEWAQYPEYGDQKPKYLLVSSNGSPAVKELERDMWVMDK